MKDKSKGVSIVLNLYEPKKDILEKIFNSFREQEVSFPLELIVVNKKVAIIPLNLVNDFKKNCRKIKTFILKVKEELSFASSMNAGIKKAHYNYIIVIQQDCIPISKKWLKNLIGPFDNIDVVATVSKVKFPDELWNQLSYFGKAIMIREKGTITPLLDEKACAYKKEALVKIGLFNDKDFKTAGEDFDIYIKLKKEGVIAYPDAAVIHYHPTDFKNRLKKFEQYANGFGTLVRMHKTRMPHWHIGFFKATPILGIIPFLLSYPINKASFLYPAYVLLTPLLNILYAKGFWKGFINKSQNIDVFKQNKNS